MNLSPSLFNFFFKYGYHQGSLFMGFRHHPWVPLSSFLKKLKYRFHPLWISTNHLKVFLSMKSFISHLTLLKHFLSMGSFMVPLYILRNLFKHGAHPYTCALWFITQGFNLSFHMKKI